MTLESTVYNFKEFCLVTRFMLITRFPEQSF